MVFVQVTKREHRPQSPVYPHPGLFSNFCPSKQQGRLLTALFSLNPLKLLCCEDVLSHFLFSEDLKWPCTAGNSGKSASYIELTRTCLWLPYINGIVKKAIYFGFFLYSQVNKSLVMHIWQCAIIMQMKSINITTIYNYSCAPVNRLLPKWGAATSSVKSWTPSVFLLLTFIKHRRLT